MSSGSGNPPTILVVEDEPNLREMLVLVLREAGFDVIGAESVSEALDVARNTVPDLVLVDIMMPGQSGLYLVRMIRTAAPAPLRDVPIVVITGLDQTEWREKAQEAGCDEFISKPIMPDKLIEVVRRYTS